MLKYYKELDEYTPIEILNDKKEKEIYTLPKRYFITKSGILYNSLGETSHKESNLIYTYNLIKDYLNKTKYKSLVNTKQLSLTKELKTELLNLNRILKTKKITKRDIKTYLNLDITNTNNINIYNLIIGIITAKIELLETFINTKNKDIFNKNDISDILVRLCGFHKIETSINKTITTASLDIYSFINYLEKDYTINIIPKLNKNDELLTNLVVDNFKSKHMEYKNKILIRGVI